MSYAPQLSDRELQLRNDQQLHDVKIQQSLHTSQLEAGNRRFAEIEARLTTLARDVSDDRRVLTGVQLKTDNNDRRIDALLDRIDALLDELSIPAPDGKPVKIKEVIIRQQYSQESMRRLIVGVGALISVVSPIILFVLQKLVWP